MVTPLFTIIWLVVRSTLWCWNLYFVHKSFDFMNYLVHCPLLLVLIIQSSLGRKQYLLDINRVYKFVCENYVFFFSFWDFVSWKIPTIEKYAYYLLIQDKSHWIYVWLNAHVLILGIHILVCFCNMFLELPDELQKNISIYGTAMNIGK